VEYIKKPTLKMNRELKRKFWKSGIALIMFNCKDSEVGFGVIFRIV
jgi:hypothetical protein